AAIVGAKLQVLQLSQVDALPIAFDDLQDELVLAFLRLKSEFRSEASVRNLLGTGHSEPQSALQFSVHEGANHGHRHDIVNVIEIPRPHRHALAVRSANHLDHGCGHVESMGDGFEAAAIDPRGKMK